MEEHLELGFLRTGIKYGRRYLHKLFQSSIWSQRVPEERLENSGEQALKDTWQPSSLNTKTLNQRFRVNLVEVVS
jgi:hypothetical protein